MWLTIKPNDFTLVNSNSVLWLSSHLELCPLTELKPYNIIRKLFYDLELWSMTLILNTRANFHFYWCKSCFIFYSVLIMKNMHLQRPFPCHIVHRHFLETNQRLKSTSSISLCTWIPYQMQEERCLYPQILSRKSERKIILVIRSLFLLYIP